MTLLTIAVMILAVVHAATPALLPHSPTIALPASFGAASQVNTRSFGGYDYPTPPQNTYPTPGYEYSTPKAYSTIPQVVTTPKNNYLPPAIPRGTVPPQVQYHPSTPHTPFRRVPNVYVPPVVSTPPSLRIVTNPKPPQIQNVYIPPVVTTPSPFRIVTNPKPPQVRNVYIPPVVTTPSPFRIVTNLTPPQVPKVYVPPVVSYQHPTPYTPFRSVTPSPPKVANFNGGPYQYTTPKTPFKPPTTPKVTVQHLTPRSPSRSLNTYLPPVQSTPRTTIHTSPPPSQTPQVPSYTPQVPSYTPKVPSYTPQVPLQPPQPPSPPRGVQPPEGREGHHHEHGTPYQYRYLVQDNNEGVDFNEDAVSDGETIRGEYKVLLPDGRRQIVRYLADWINGYNAVVEYEGNAVYPDQVARSQYGK